ncbi:MAG TPA: MFS transporter [Thermoanaerobaculia bacterium]|nr:MFS transporter [Thermoanaerobaculia bacterium]
MSRRLTGTFAALRIRPFRILWIGTWFAFVGFFMSTVVQSVVAFKLTGANRDVGLVIFGQGLMMFTLGPLGGAVADRLPKRRVIALSQLATTAVFFAISWALWSGRIQLAWLVAGSMVMGASFAFLGPARQSLAVELVAPELRGNAIALTQVANSACRVVGPALGGALLAWSANGAWVAYAVMGLFYLTSVVSVGLLPKSTVREGARARRVLEDMLDGLRYVRHHDRLGTLMLLFTLVIIVGYPHVTILPGFVENQLGAASESASILWGVSALGSLVASLMVAAMADSPRASAYFSRLALGFGVSLIVVALAPGFAAVTVLMGVVGLVSGGFQTLAGAVIVRQTEPRYIGRVMSLTMLSFAGFGLMGLPIGALADALGERVTFAALGVVVCGVVAWLRTPATESSD